MPVPTIEWKSDCARIIDQTKLPKRYEFICIKDVRRMWRAIKRLEVRGAPALGAAGALGAYLGIRGSKAKNWTEFKNALHKATSYLGTSRPTAVNLFWALKRVEETAKRNRFEPVEKIKTAILKEAKDIIQEDKDICRQMGLNGAKLIKNGDRVLTHCNAGALATVDFGTAVGVFYQAKRQGKKIKVYADETRPLLQGARLTAWELLKHRIDATVLCDNMAGSLMKEGAIDKIFVGADRVAANGDAANKIGTYGLAVLANHHKIPFYIVAPISTIDFSLKSGSGIPIEHRDKKEVINWGGVQTAPDNIKVYNPAFDVTPARLITAIITEKGIARPPYTSSLRRSRLRRRMPI